MTRQMTECQQSNKSKQSQAVYSCYNKTFKLEELVRTKSNVYTFVLKITMKGLINYLNNINDTKLYQLQFVSTQVGCMEEIIDMGVRNTTIELQQCKAALTDMV